MAGNVYRFDPPPQQGVRNATLPAGAGAQPPRSAFSLTTLAIILAAWQPVPTVPTVLVPFQPTAPPMSDFQVPRGMFDSVTARVVRQSWQTFWTATGQGSGTSGPPIMAPPYPMGIIFTWQPGTNVPPLPLSAAWNQPPVISPFLPAPATTQLVITQAWVPLVAVDFMQTGAAAFIPAPQDNPPVLLRQPEAIGTAWQPAYVAPPAPVTFEFPTTLDVPPVQGMVVPLAVRAWDFWWTAQTAPPNAGWNVTVIVPGAPQDAPGFPQDSFQPFSGFTR